MSFSPLVMFNKIFCFHSVHAPNPSVDRTNFKKKNWLSSYVNSMFNAGVFVNPYQDGC